MPELSALALVFYLGAIWGSFANMLIVRIPSGENIVLPSSHCDHCNEKLKWYHNIPIFSCLILGAKCAYCKKSFGWRHLFVEILMGFSFLGVFWYYGYSWTSLEYLILVVGLITVSMIDLDLRIIPDKISLPGIVIGLLGAAINPERAFLDSFLGVLLGGGVLLAIAYLYFALKKVDGMGGGDIKLLAWIGSVLGVKSILFVLFFSSVVGSLVGIFFMIFRKEGLKSSLAFGPYLALAALVYLFWGPEIINWYFGFSFPWLTPSM
ncbi:MAG: prepilin peptidase [Bdellovibrionota bacterium]